MLPAGYPPQLLFSARPDAVVHFPRSFVALLPFCLSAFPVRARTAFLRFLSFSRLVVPLPFPVFRSASLTSIKKAPRREPKIKTLLKIARIRRILQKVSEFSV